MNDTVKETYRLGSLLFLVPENVLALCHYWLTQYANYLLVEREEEIFIDFIRGLLQNKPRLHITTMITFSGTLHFVGTLSHAIPLEFFSRTYQITLIESLAHLVDPGNKCFSYRSPGGLCGEIELDHFIYNPVLDHLYEPSFTIMIAYLVHILAILSITSESEFPIESEWITRHLYSLRAIHPSALDSLACLDPSGPNYKKRIKGLRGEMGELYALLNTTDLQQASLDLSELCSRKASYCLEEIENRQQSLFI